MAERFWSCVGISVVICDGTLTWGLGFKHALLMSVKFNGSNKLLTPALAVVSVGNSENQVWLKERPEQDFPGVHF